MTAQCFGVSLRPALIRAPLIATDCRPPIHTLLQLRPAASGRRRLQYCAIRRVSGRAEAGSDSTSSLREAATISATGFASEETITVPCGSNGAITLDIFGPPTDRSLHSPIILYLPPGPIVADTQPDNEAALLLRRLSAWGDAIVVRINYRLDGAHKFPTPVHDVLTGYDWVTTHLRPSFGRKPPRHSSTGHVPGIGVCGELVGGSLALMLALTECRLGRDRVVAAAVNNPIVDWLFPQHDTLGLAEISYGEGAGIGDCTHELMSGPHLDQESPKKQTRAKESAWDRYSDSPQLSASHLYRARSTVFKSVEAALDPFVSPILFFRSPGVNLAPSCNIEAPGFTNLHPKKRKVPRLYPPTGSSLRLPALRITAGESSILRDQATELLSRMRRSIVRQHTTSSKDGENRRSVHELTRDNGKENGSQQDGNVEDGTKGAEEAAGRMVQLSLNPGVGLWSSMTGDTDKDRDAWKIAEFEKLVEWYRLTLMQ